MLVLTGNALGLFFSEYIGFPRHHHSILENPLNFSRLKNSYYKHGCCRHYWSHFSVILMPRSPPEYTELELEYIFLPVITVRICAIKFHNAAAGQRNFHIKCTIRVTGVSRRVWVDVGRK
jgi:hypothetical protein